MTANASQPSKILGTAGHIDHGKSSLVQALTGTDPDRLAEEKRRGITITLGFAELELPDGSSMGVVDVPGHERFVKQMIAGSTGIDVALLCIAADDGVMPQTLEHLAVLEVLSIPSCVIALTKADLVDADWLEFVSDDIRRRLAGSPFAESAIIPCSARSGLGLDQLKQALLEETRKPRTAKGRGYTRMPIDRVFSIKGSGTVVTGTLWSGAVSLEDELELLPSHELARVRSVQVHGQQAATAKPGNRVAINLNALKTDDVRVGDMLASPGCLALSDRFDAYCNYLDFEQSGKPLKSGVRVHVSHGTREVLGRILLMDGKTELAPQTGCYAQIRLEEALPLARGDHFVIRSYSPVSVLGGGSVLICRPRRRTTLSTPERDLLEALKDNDDAAACRAAVSLQNTPFSASQIAPLLEIDLADIDRLLADLCNEGVLKRIGKTGAGGFYASPRILQKELGGIENALLAFHADKPLETGLSKGELHKISKSRASADAFDALLEESQRSGKIAVAAGEISHPKASAPAQKREQQAADDLFALLAKDPAAPPTIQDLIGATGLDQSLAHRGLGLLEKQGKAQRVGNDFYFETKALAAFERAVVAHLQAQGTATVSELKEAMQTSRKYAVPLLEYFDNRKITRREGEGRVLAQ